MKDLGPLPEPLRPDPGVPDYNGPQWPLWLCLGVIPSIAAACLVMAALTALGKV